MGFIGWTDKGVAGFNAMLAVFVPRETCAGNYAIEFPLRAVAVDKDKQLCLEVSGKSRCRKDGVSLRSVEVGLRPSASDTCLPAPPNFPFGEDQVSSSICFTLTLRIMSS